LSRSFASGRCIALSLLWLPACGGLDFGDDRWSMLGPHEVTIEEGMGPDGQLFVYRPSDLETDAPHPVIVWSVGTGGSPDSYGGLLEHWASHGFVVVAGDDGNQANGDQALLALDWVIDQNAAGGLYEGMLDEGAIAASGHSQGGNACLHVALRDDRVRTVLPIEPGVGELGDAEIADESTLTIPVFYICGENDKLVPPDWCRDRFDGTPADAWVGVVRDANHFAPVGGKVGSDDVEIRRYGTRWLHAYLNDDAEALEAFEGDTWELEMDAAWMDVMRR
jgi:predicted dienelactone hydrolase